MSWGQTRRKRSQASLTPLSTGSGVNAGPSCRCWNLAEVQLTEADAVPHPPYYHTVPVHRVSFSATVEISRQTGSRVLYVVGAPSSPSGVPPELETRYSRATGGSDLGREGTIRSAHWDRDAQHLLGPFESRNLGVSETWRDLPSRPSRAITTPEEHENGHRQLQ